MTCFRSLHLSCVIPQTCKKDTSKTQKPLELRDAISQNLTLDLTLEKFSPLEICIFFCLIFQSYKKQQEIRNKTCVCLVVCFQLLCFHSKH